MCKKIILLSTLFIIVITMGSGCSSYADPSVSEGDDFIIKLVNITQTQEKEDADFGDSPLINITVAELNLTNTESTGKENREFYLSRPYFSDSNDVKHYVIFEQFFDDRWKNNWYSTQYPYLDKYMEYDNEGNLACSYSGISLTPGESTKIYIPFEYNPTKTDKLCFDLITYYESKKVIEDKYWAYSITLSLQ